MCVDLIGWSSATYIRHNASDCGRGKLWMVVGSGSLVHFWEWGCAVCPARSGRGFIASTVNVAALNRSAESMSCIRLMLLRAHLALMALMRALIDIKRRQTIAMQRARDTRVSLANRCRQLDAFTSYHSWPLIFIKCKTIPSIVGSTCFLRNQERLARPAHKPRARLVRTWSVIAAQVR